MNKHQLRICEILEFAHKNLKPLSDDCKIDQNSLLASQVLLDVALNFIRTKPEMLSSDALLRLSDGQALWKANFYLSETLSRKGFDNRHDVAESVKFYKLSYMLTMIGNMFLSDSLEDKSTQFDGFEAYIETGCEEWYRTQATKRKQFWSPRYRLNQIKEAAGKLASKVADASPARIEIHIINKKKILKPTPRKMKFPDSKSDPRI